tara:strand:- start:112 stop:345 length:234 start_codon:yes stop_codon:yes gene_type:complete
MSDSNFNFSDEVIGQLAKLIQMAILSGTDIVDHIRQIRLVAIGETLHLSKDYEEQFENNIQTMLQELEENVTKNATS